jgi:hypothetical protein
MKPRLLTLVAALGVVALALPAGATTHPLQADPQGDSDAAAHDIVSVDAQADASGFTTVIELDDVPTSANLDLADTVPGTYTLYQSDLILPGPGFREFRLELVRDWTGAVSADVMYMSPYGIPSKVTDAIATLDTDADTATVTVSFASANAAAASVGDPAIGLGTDVEAIFEVYRAYGTYPSLGIVKISDSTDWPAIPYRLGD